MFNIVDMNTQTSHEVLKAVATLYQQHHCNAARAARESGVPRATFFDRLKKARQAGLVHDLKQEDPMVSASKFTYTPLPDSDISVEELIEHRIKQFSRKKAHEDARRLIKVKVHTKGPIGIWHLGDPHCDDDGTDIALLRDHINIIRKTEGLFGANVGDSSNNWVGRLSHLWGQQSTSAKQMWQLVDWLIKSTQWLYLIGGNHDCHDSSTECLTKRGWLKYTEITDADEILSFIPKTGECEWTPILKRVIKRHDGLLVDIRTQSVDISVTPAHRVLCKARGRNLKWTNWDYTHAENLSSRIAVPVCGESTSPGVRLSDDQIALTGWLLTDGHIAWKGNSPKITFYQSKDGTEINRLLSALNLSHKVRVRKRNIQFIAGRKLVSPPLDATEWSLHAKSSRKVLSWVPRKGVLPDWAFQLNARQFSILIDSIVAGDGTWDGADKTLKNVAVVHGTSGFLSSLQAAAVMHGWNARLSVARGKDYRLNICKRTTVQFDTKKAISKRPYRGDVWCLTVPHGNFMVRRNGSAHFSGNCWSGEGDPIKWMMKGQEAPYQSSEVRLELCFPNKNTCRINARHDFSGHSQYNPVHGPMKANMFGARDHIAVAGHRHVSGHGVLKNPDDGSLCHSFLVAGYKIYDRYAMEKGFRDQRISTGVFTIINPEVPNTHPDFILHCWDIETGVFLLKALRKRYA